MPFAQYRIGTAQRPQLYHDPGFADCSRAPTVRDRAIYAGWLAALEVAEAGQSVPMVPHNNLPDALAAYRHFLYGKGRPRSFSYDRYVANDTSGRVTLENAVADIQEGIEDLANQNPHSSGFEVTGSGIRCEDDGSSLNPFPYPETENWQKTIGAHWIWLSAVVAVNRGSPRSFVTTLTLHAEDLYNFNPGDNDLATNIPDALNGRLEETCLGQEYLNLSKLTRVIRWAEKALNKTAVSQNDSDRKRSPQNNLRLRNRI